MTKETDLKKKTNYIWESVFLVFFISHINRY